MRCTIHMDEPSLLHEARQGQLFVPHIPEYQECVCARAHYDGQALRADDEDIEFVVVACRVGLGEIGHRAIGECVLSPRDTWITRIEAVEPAAFRERLPEARLKAQIDADLTRQRLADVIAALEAFRPQAA